MSSSNRSCVSSNDPKLRRLLQAWLSVCRRYHRMTEDDRVWNYHERALTGFLAGAVWRAGGVALEEWRTDKKNDDGDRRNGRGDLWLQMPDDLYLHLEAKHTRVLLGQNVTAAVEQTKAMFRKAQADARHVSCGVGERRAGALFVVPTVSPRTLGDVESRLQDWLTAIRGCGHQGLAWLPHTTLPQKGGKWPVPVGVLLLLGRPRRADA
jgi:hypothetical protein